MKKNMVLAKTIFVLVFTCPKNCWYANFSCNCFHNSNFDSVCKINIVNYNSLTFVVHLTSLCKQLHTMKITK